MQNAKQHAEFFAQRTGDQQRQAQLHSEAAASLVQQRAIEDADKLSFPEFVDNYLSL